MRAVVVAVCLLAASPGAAADHDGRHLEHELEHEARAAELARAAREEVLRRRISNEAARHRASLVRCRAGRPDNREWLRLHLVVDARGRVTEARITDDETGDPVLAACIRAAAAHWRLGDRALFARELVLSVGFDTHSAAEAGTIVVPPPRARRTGRGGEAPPT